jgi:hypothetical protein
MDRSGSRPPPVHDLRVLPHAEEDGVIEHSPAAHVRRPRVDYGSHVVGLRRRASPIVAVAMSGAIPRPFDAPVTERKGAVPYRREAWWWRPVIVVTSGSR